MSIPGGWELVIILLVIVLLFGAKRLPALAKGLGESIREIRKAKKDIVKAVDDITREN